MGDANWPIKMKVVNIPKTLPRFSGEAIVTRHKFEFGINNPAPKPEINKIIQNRNKLLKNSS